MIINNKMIVTEAYHGRNKNIQNALKEMKLLYPKFEKAVLNFEKMKFINDEHTKKLCKYLSDEFGGEINVYFSTISTVGTMTGPHTIPGTFKFFKRKDGKIDHSNSTMHIFMDIGMLIHHKLTPEEFMAILLHEIGHNIDPSATTLINAVIGTVLGFGVSELLHRVQKMSYNLLEFVPSFVKTFTGFFAHGTMEYINLVKPLRIPMAVQQLAIALPALPFTMLGYYGERFGDSVAASYGFGPELATALPKLSGRDITKKGNAQAITVSKILVNSNPISGLAWDYTDALFDFMTVFYAPHPRDINRAKNTLAKLKAESNNPKLPAPLRKDLNRDIKEIEEAVEKLETIDMSQYTLFTSSLNKILSSGEGRNRNILDVIYNAEKYEF